MDESIRRLGRALLVMHSPLDRTVSIDNAEHIFKTAEHPKSFVTLNEADHLLLNPADARYAGEVIAAIGGSEISLDTARASGVAELSYRFDASRSGISPDLTVATFDAGYVFAGGGMTGRRHFSGQWFLEAGAQVGVLSYDDGTEPALRASLGVGRGFGSGTRASLGLAQIASEDARLSSVTLRLHFTM